MSFSFRTIALGFIFNAVLITSINADGLSRRLMERTQRVSLLILGPGKALNSSFGHVDLLLSSFDEYSFTDTIVGFGPHPDDNPRKGEARMFSWTSSLRERFEDAVESDRNWLKIVPLELSAHERARALHALNHAKKMTPFTTYQTFRYNCSTVATSIIAWAKGEKLRALTRHHPLGVESLFRWKSWVEGRTLTYRRSQMEEIADGAR